MTKEAALRKERLQKGFPLLLEITEIIVTSLTKLIRDLFLTVIVNFDIPLCNLKVHYIVFFFSKSLPLVCEYPHRNIYIYIKNNNMK